MICSQGECPLLSLQCHLHDPATLQETTQQERLPYTQRKNSPENLDLLWRDHFRTPSGWWDARNTKSNAEFKHKVTEEPLWIHDHYNLCWDQEELRKRGLQSAANKEDGYLNVEKRMGGTSYTEEEEDLTSSNNNGPLEIQGNTHEALTLVALLKACAKQKDLRQGIKIHNDAVNRGLLRNNVFLGSALINLYAKCGALEKAQEVFDKLSNRNIVAWNALIGGYAQHGPGEEALNCLERMQLDSLRPNAITYTCILKACSKMRALDKGQDIHERIAKENLLEDNVVLANAVLDMYAKCGALQNAQNVFDELQNRDVVSWIALISGYAQHGRVKEAFSYYDRMRHEGVSPTALIFVCMFKACGSIGAVDKGQEIHAQAVKEHWFEKNIGVANAVIAMYAKCGALDKAREVFDKLVVRDIVSWTALITGYAQHRHGEEALDCYERMQLEGFCPNAFTFSCLLKACGIVEAIETGQTMHAQIVRLGLLGKDVVVGNALIDMYAKCSALAKARQVFEELRLRDVVSWTALIVGYVQHEHCREALNCFEQMQLEGFSPDGVTFGCILKACGSIGAADKGRDVHILILRKNLLEKDIMVANALVDMYAKCGLVDKAQEVFDGLRFRDVVSWNALIAGYVQHDYCEKAMNYFSCMQSEGFFPDGFTFACVLKACGTIGAAYVGQRIHAEAVRYGLLEKDMVVGTGLVDMYANCGMPSEAQDVFEKLPVRNVVLWSAFMEGYAQLGKDELVIDVFDKMIGDGRVPDSITLTIMLNTCSHRGLLDKGQSYFEIISRVYGITPNLEHYACMVDLFTRAGHFDKAMSVIEEMPLSVNLPLLHTLLGACRNLGNMKLGRWAFKCAVQLDEKDGGSYVGMSNIYGVAGRQIGVDQREFMRMREQALKKPVRCWWSDTSRLVHSFSVGNNDHKDFHLNGDWMARFSNYVSPKNYDQASIDLSCEHSEKLAIAGGLINSCKRTHVLFIKNMWTCVDCHSALSLISHSEKCRISVRDATRLHIFKEGKCLCGEICGCM